MAVEGLRDGFFEIGAQRGLFCQTLQEDLSLVQKAGSAIAALERVVFDETLLQRREFACLGMALDGSDRLPVKADCGHDTGRLGVARPVRIIDNHYTTQALGCATPEFCASHSEIFAQEIVHCQLVAHFDRTVRATIDRELERTHASTRFSMSGVTGSERNR